MTLKSPRSFCVLVLVTILCIDLMPIIVVAEEPENDVNTTTSRIAVVTGANKGLGFGIVKGLCEQFDGIVYLTARSEARGRAAVEKLNKVGLYPKFYQLDINNDSSIEALKNYLNDTYGRVDILVNNAAINFKPSTTAPISIQASETINVNYFGLLKVSNALFPLMRPHARVVHISSNAGHLTKILGAELRARLSSSELTEDGLSQLMRDYVQAAKIGNHLALGWARRAYEVSKVGVSALTRIQQKKFDADDREDLVVNAVHPGYVITDMSSQTGYFTPERGAQAPLYLALLPNNTDIKGKYVWHDNTIVDWENGPVPNLY